MDSKVKIDVSLMIKMSWNPTTGIGYEDSVLF